MAGKRERDRKALKYTSARKVIERSNSGYEPTSVRLPDGVGFFSLKQLGNYKVDVLPFFVGKGNPHADEGFVHYERTYYTHRLPDGKSHTCLQVFGKSCPVCKWCLANRNATDDFTRDVVKDCKAKTRILWALIDVTSAESAAEGIKVWETGDYKSFGELFKNKIGALEEYENFFHLDGGYTLMLNVVEDSFSTKPGQTATKYKKVGNIEMLPRKKAYDESILDKVPCLDDCIVEPSYKALERLFFVSIGEPVEDEEPAEEPARRGAAPADEEEDEAEDTEEEEEGEAICEGETVEHPRHGVCTVIGVNGVSGKLTLRPKGSKLVHSGIDPSVCERVEEEEEEEEIEDEEPAKAKAAKAPAKASKAKKDEEEEEEDEEDFDDISDEEEDEPPARTKRK
jgi:hypothetical protein